MSVGNRPSRVGNRRHRAHRSRSLPGLAQLAATTLALTKRSLPMLAVASSIAIALGGGYAGYQWLTHAQRFAIQDFDIKGSNKLTAQELINLLDLPEHANIFRTDMDTLESRLLENPWIVHAEVSRLLPQGLKIRVKEREAVAAVELDGLYLLSKKGELFKRATPGNGELEDLCIITGVQREQFVEAPAQSQERFAYALDALAHYRKNSERPRIGELHFDERGGLSLITFEDAVAIHLGKPIATDFDDRFEAFDSAFKALSEDEHAQARAFRIADRTPSDRVTVAFAGN